MTVIKINLLPQEIKKKRVAEKGAVILIGILVLVVAVCFLITSLLYMKAGQEEQKLEVIKNNIQKKEKEISKYGVYKERKQQVQAHKSALDLALKNEVFWHRFVNELSMVVPSDISLSLLEIEETGDISIEGGSFEYATVAELMVRLNELETITDIWLSKIETTELEKATVVGSETSTTSEEEKILGVTFKIVAKLKNPISSETGTTASSTSSSSSSSSSSSTNSSSSGGSS